MKTKAVRESKVEETLRETYEARGGLCLKFTSPNRVGVPDRLGLDFIPPEHRAIVAKYFRFIELKRPGKGVEKGSPQERRHKELRDLGYRVDVVNSLEGARG